MRRRSLKYYLEGGFYGMANVKTKTRAKKRAPSVVHEVSGFDKIVQIFPRIQVTKWTESNRGKCGRDYVIEVSLPKCYHLLSKQVSHKGEILAITFSVEEKHCNEDQIPGTYHVTA